jgi:hypothetical protein
VRLTFGLAGADPWMHGAVRRSADAWRALDAPMSPPMRQGGARALAPRFRQKQRTRRSS